MERYIYIYLRYMDLHHSHLLIMIITFLIFIIINVASAASIPDASTYTPKGWKMTDRFYGIRYEVFGKVQGVWFRKTTQEMADKLACFGWVQNTIRGTVVGEARCSKVNGPKFEKYLHEGPELARVDKVDVLVYPNTKIKLHFSDFPILDDDRETCFKDKPHQCEQYASNDNNKNDDQQYNEL